LISLLLFFRQRPSARQAQYLPTTWSTGPPPSARFRAWRVPDVLVLATPALRPAAVQVSKILPEVSRFPAIANAHLRRISLWRDRASSRCSVSCSTWSVALSGTRWDAGRFRRGRQNPELAKSLEDGPPNAGLRGVTVEIALEEGDDRGGFFPARLRRRAGGERRSNTSFGRPRPHRPSAQSKEDAFGSAGSDDLEPSQPGQAARSGHDSSSRSGVRIPHSPARSFPG